MLRTHEAGTLRAAHTGQTVTLTGWVAKRRDHGGVAFIDLRDASGIVQVVARDEVLTGAAHDLRSEYVVKVVGEVTARAERNVNPDLPTGEVEVVASLIEVLNASAPLPFQVDERVTVGEEARLKHRYLDLRRPGTQSAGHAIRLRSKVNAAARRVLGERDFVEIETPTLTRSTPEGARDFLVPARLAPGSWYALPQSPQLFKQLLMVAGMERYYQIARCYRDEDFRADRQPEFTQLDIEMSFVEQADVLELGEAVVREIWRAHRRRAAHAVPAADLRRGDEALRHRQARPALRARARRVHRLLRRHPVPGVPERVRRRGRHARRREPAAQAARRLAGVGQAARRPRPRLRAGAGRRHPHRAGRQEPVREPSWPGWPSTSAPGRATASSSRPAPRSPSRAPARGGPPRDRQARRPDRRVGVELPVGRRRPALRARRGCRRGR